METPTFTKREPRPYDYQEMTWAKFIRLREWAKEAVKEINFPIYLVGSTLKKEIPRDFDIVIIIPEKEFEEMFDKVTEDNWTAILAKSNCWFHKHYWDCQECFGEQGFVPLDWKVYPDNWFIEEDRLLLAEPNHRQI